MIWSLILLLATPGDQLEARRTFEQAQERIKAQDYLAARPLLQDSLARYPTAASAFNLAVVHRALGEYVEARALLERLREGAYGPLSSDQTRSVERWLGDSREKIARVRVNVGQATQWLKINDGERVPVENPLDPIELNPGRHTLRAGGSAGVMTQSVELGPGESRVVEFHLDALQATQAPPSEEPSLFESTWFWVGVSVVALSSTVAAVVLLRDGDEILEVPQGGTVTTEP